jgi:hypothetical protein
MRRRFYNSVIIRSPLDIRIKNTANSAIVRVGGLASSYYRYFKQAKGHRQRSISEFEIDLNRAVTNF